MRHFNEKRELVESEPSEFWDDIDYMPSMDRALWYLFNPEKCDVPDCAIRQQKWWNEHSNKVTQ